MQLLPNYNLAGFLQKKLFAERGFVFVDAKGENLEEKSLEFRDESLDLEEIGNIGKTAALEEFKYVAREIGHGTREAIDCVDTDGHIGLGGVSRTEAVAENVEMSLRDLLREADDYNSEIQGIEREADEFEDELGFELQGGSENSPAKMHFTENFESYNQSVSKKYEALCEIREGLKYQERGSNAMKRYIQKYKDELEEERQERIGFVLEDRQIILEKIAEKIENEKKDLEENLNTLSSLCVEPELLKEHFEDGREVGFFDHIRRKTAIEELLKKIRNGKAEAVEVEEMSQEIDYQKKKVAEKRKSIERLQNLQENEFEQKKMQKALLAEVQGILANYRLANSQNLDPEKAPKHPAERKMVQEVIRFEERLNSGKILPAELISLESTLLKFKQPLQKIKENPGVLDLEIPVDKTAEEMQIELETKCQKFLKQPVPIHPEARELFERCQTEIKTLQAEMNEANLKNQAFANGQLSQDGKEIEGDEESLRKYWLADKMRSLQKYEETIRKANNSSFERRARMREQERLNEYLKQIETAQEPSEVVEKLLQEEPKHLTILSANKFKTDFVDKGITNSYLVIEQTEYHPEIPNYSGDDWMIYLDEAYYNKLQAGEGNLNRFKARIAHELGHREFEVSARQKLEDEGIYQNEKWSSLKSGFNTLLQGKTVGGDDEGYSKNEHVLNELYALSKENAVAEIVDDDLRNLVEDFDKVAQPMLKKTIFDFPKKSILGAVDQTGDDAEEEQGQEEVQQIEEKEKRSEEKKSEDSEKLHKAKGKLVSAFKKFEDNLRLFGVDLDKAEEKESDTKEDQEDEKEKKILDISVIEGGDKFLEKALGKHSNFKNQVERLKDLEQADVNKIMEEVDLFNERFDKAETIISEQGEKQGYFSKLLDDTKFLSADDIFHLITESWEFAQKRRNRNSEDARAAFGQKLYGDTLLGNEYLGKRQKLEMDAVSEYEGNLKNMPDRQVYELLFHPKNKDHFKAVIGELCNRGLMRWDDPRIWNLFGKYTFVKIPNYDKASGDNIYRNKWLRSIVMDIWDETTWDSWKKGNDSNLDSELGKLEPETKELHNMGGGRVKVQLKKYLDAEENNFADFKKGKNDNFIMPNQRYHKLIDYAIKGGYLGMEDKFYFLIAGVHHRLLTIEQLQKIQAEGLGAIPILELFYSRNNTYPELDAMYERIEKNGGYPNGMHKMLMQELANDPNLRVRFSKIISRKNISNIDHDDWHTMMMMMNSQDVDKALKRVNGTDCQITSDSVLNGITSFSSFVKAQKHVVKDIQVNGNEQQLENVLLNIEQSLNSFVQYDGRIMQRVAQREGEYWNIEQRQLDKKMHGYKISQYQESMYRFISKVFELYEGQSGVDYVERIQTNIIKEGRTKKAQIRQNGLQDDVEKFTTKIGDLMQTERGKNAVIEALNQVSDSMVGYQGKDFDYTINTSWD